MSEIVKRIALAAAIVGVPLAASSLPQESPIYEPHVPDPYCGDSVPRVDEQWSALTGVEGGSLLEVADAVIELNTSPRGSHAEVVVISGDAVAYHNYDDLVSAAATQLQSVPTVVPGSEVQVTSFECGTIEE